MELELVLDRVGTTPTVRFPRARWCRCSRRRWRRSPDAVALVFEGKSLTYAEFDARVNRLARHLISVGVGPESLVALAMRRSLDLLVGDLCGVKAGGAYVPVDPDQPADRIGHVLDTAAPVCVLTTVRDVSTARGTVRSADRRARPVGRCSDGPIADADRLGLLDAVECGVRDLHVGFDGSAEGCRGHARGDREPAGVDAGRSIGWTRRMWCCRRRR